MIHKKLMLLLLFGLFMSYTTSVFADVYVHGYTRSDGTYVKPHYRSDPDGDFNNNWSTEGNINPYTGEEGTKTFPDYNNGYGGTTSSNDNYEYDESTTIPDYNSWYDETNTSLDYSTEDMGKYSREVMKILNEPEFEAELEKQQDELKEKYENELMKQQNKLKEKYQNDLKKAQNKLKEKYDNKLEKQQEEIDKLNKELDESWLDKIINSIKGLFS